MDGASYKRRGPFQEKENIGGTLEASTHAILEVFFRNKWGSAISSGACWVTYPNNMNFDFAIANDVLIPGRI